MGGKVFAASMRMILNKRQIEGEEKEIIKSDGGSGSKKTDILDIF